MPIQRGDILKHIIELKDHIGEIQGTVGGIKSNVETLVNGAADRENRIRKLEATSKYRSGVIGAILFIAGGITSWYSGIVSWLHRI